MKNKPVIFGCSGENLTLEERIFFEKNNPIGFILFARNCNNPTQIKRLVTSLCDATSADTPLILIDQEGGRVARIKPPHWKETPPAGFFANMAKNDGIDKAEHAVYTNYLGIAEVLCELGINVNCAPILDLYIEGRHDIIGDRAFGKDTSQVTVLAKAACKGLMDGGVMPVIKHIPGHGRARVDSHKELPIVNTSRNILEEEDFIPFKELSDMPFAMTAHIKYTSIDDENCATLSSKVINIIRNSIGFDGVLITDDLSMKALGGTFANRAKKSLEAGCDILLHCNADMKEMVEIANIL